MKFIFITLLNYVAIVVFFLVLIILIYGLIIPSFNLSTKTLYFSELALIIELSLVLIIYMLALTFTARKYLSLCLTVFFYCSFIAANLVKIIFLKAPLFPVDLLQIEDFVLTKNVFIEFIPSLTLFVILLVLTLVVGINYELKNRRLKIVSLNVLLLVFSSIFLLKEQIPTYLEKNYLYLRKNSNLVNRFIRNGFLNNFTQALFFLREVETPKNYSSSNLNAIRAKYDYESESVVTDPRRVPDNVIIILLESFVDISNLGWKTNIDINPAFTRLAKDGLSGTVFVPVYGGKSVNTEFELLTGMSNNFNPIGSIAYRELILSDVPSLAREYSKQDLEPSVLQAVKMGGFGFEKVYSFLGIDNAISLVGDNINYDPTNKFASSETFFEQIKELTINQKKSFIYAFHNSSHMPWRISDYPDNKIKLLDTEVSKNQQDTLIAYFNAINHVDLLIEYLVEYFSQSDEKTIILFVGDHQPSLSILRANKNVVDEVDEVKQLYSTSYAIWSNYLPNYDIKDEISINFLGALLLKNSGIKPSGFLKYNQLLMEKIGVFGKLVKNMNNGKFELIVPKDMESIFSEYQLLQYEALTSYNEK